ncbi:MAG: hypothetical protein HPM95_01200 [Alphaproteobacteria bacterium]|nr:hypothetical protein [Alphaproteobacteria bacterium]
MIVELEHGSASLHRRKDLDPVAIGDHRFARASAGTKSPLSAVATMASP